ncbi:putative choline/ethanolamine kinase [Leptomonas pyrrhocoris]|uniref:Putative choline/ethanolamine kinase n=1 Tax=Leptomonas pyrrhocoris TaxID=157538 RepID=A0A0M9GA44_LEPPY|nr:putative choline/ethanolamine kinase [Leptomonas pyrrhocoris]KPA86060.1 putative choline/ethanolamine kinase [Leptomonas pyrrhocoris]|eukprot:XP_015664499.1 putative choline/ethanolamine kinase [Leptomonas pyrrhocoris]
MNQIDAEKMYRSMDVRQIITLSTHETPRSALYEYVRSVKNEATQSSPASVASDDSFESDFSLSAHNSTNDVASDFREKMESAETRDLIYRLCRSLHKKALQKTQGSRQQRHKPVAVDAKHEKNMSHVGDWMPLLHLFDPQAFFAGRAATPAPFDGGAAAERPLSMNVATSAKEASLLLLGEMDVEKLSGGNSNHVYRLAHPDFPDKTILLRVYGSGDSEAIDRVRDVMAMKEMSEAKLSPAVLHSFKWGRVEEFMDDVATCSTDMLLSSPTLLSEVWSLVHEMHRLPYAAFLPENVNNAKIRSVLHLGAEEPHYGTPEEYCEVFAESLKKVVLAKRTSSYYTDDTSNKLMEDLCPSSFERTCMRFLRLTNNLIKESYRASFVSFISAEVMLLRELLRKRAVPLVFSHNDLNPGNILLAWRKVPAPLRSPAKVLTADDEDDEVTSVTSDKSTAFSRKFLTKRGHHRNLVDMKGIIFIDFEYSDVNYRCFDLGNTICELDYDYSRGTGEGEPGFIKYLYVFPPKEYEEKWKGLPMTYPRAQELIYHTWRQSSGAPGVREDAADARPHLGHICLQALQTYFNAGAAPTAANRSAAPVTLEQLTEVFLGMLCSHLNWSLWSFVMCANPDECTNNASDDDLFAKGSSGLDYIYYGNCRLQEYLALKQWMREKQMI